MILRLPDTHESPAIYPPLAAQGGDREFALLLACARAAPRACDVAAQQTLAAGLDSPRFLALAGQHMVLPLVWRNLSRLPQGTLDAGLMDDLFHAYRANVISEMASAHEASRLHQLLSGAGIAHCLLKGLAVSVRYYAGDGQRGIGDIDLLIPRSGFAEANRLLQEAGYVVSAPVEALTPRQRRYFMFQQNQLAYTHPASGVGVELHWRPDQMPFTLGALDAFAGRANLPLGDCTIPCLDHDEMLLHLCVHGGKHVWFRLKWIFDLPNVLEGRDWDWAALRKKAQANRCEHALLLGLAVAERFCGWEVPPPVRAWLAESNRFEPHFALIGRALASEDGWLNSPAGILRRNRYAARFNDGLDCWGYQLATFATHRRDWELLPLPDALFPLYFLLSPFTNALEIGRRFTKGLSGNGRSSGPDAQQSPSAAPGEH